METFACVCGSVATACALAGGFSAASAFDQVRAALRSSQAATGNPGFIARWVRNGFGWALPAADALLQSTRARTFFDACALVLRERGMHATAHTLASLGIVATAVTLGVAGALTASFVGACAVAAGLWVVTASRIGVLFDRRREAVREAVPQALESMQACFSAGLTLHQTFQQTARAVTGPLSSVFAQAAHVLETGGGASRALMALKEEPRCAELAFIAVALDVQHQTGGSMRRVLEAAFETVEGELALQRSLRVHTAQAKLSAQIVVAMPFLLVAAFSLASPGFIAPFFASASGIGLFILAVSMEIAGIVLVRRALEGAKGAS